MRKKEADFFLQLLLGAVSGAHGGLGRRLHDN